MSMRNIAFNIAVIVLFVTSHAFGWQWSLTNYTDRDLWMWGEYLGCSDDHPKLVAKFGGVQHQDAKECLLSSVKGKEAWTNIAAVPYKSSGQRTYDRFYAIGPVDNGDGKKILIGRIQEGL